RRVRPPLQRRQGQAAPERVVVSCQLLEPALLQHLPRVVHGAKVATASRPRMSIMRYPVRVTISRLAHVPWHALRSDVVLPAIARTREGVPAEREIDRH